MIHRPSSIDEALKLPLEELAKCGDFGGVLVSQVTDNDNKEEVEKLIETQLKLDRSKYDRFNITSLGNMARIIVSGQNKMLVSRAQENYDDYKVWYNERYYMANILNGFIKFLNPIFLK